MAFTAHGSTGLSVFLFQSNSKPFNHSLNSTHQLISKLLINYIWFKGGKDNSQRGCFRRPILYIALFSLSPARTHTHTRFALTLGQRSHINIQMNEA